MRKRDGARVTYIWFDKTAIYPLTILSLSREICWYCYREYITIVIHTSPREIFRIVRVQGSRRDRSTRGCCAARQWEYRGQFGGNLWSRREANSIRPENFRSARGYNSIESAWPACATPSVSSIAIYFSKHEQVDIVTQAPKKKQM